MNIAVVLVILGVLWLMKGGGLSLSAGSAPADGIPPPGGDCGGVGGFIKGHVDRKNAIAPTVISKYTGAGGGTSKTIAKYAAELSPSGYVESYVGDKVGNALCNLNPLEAAAAGAQWVGGKLAEGAQAAVKGGKALGSFAYNASTNPLSTATGLAQKGANASAAATNYASSLTDRGVNAVYSHLPTPLKIAAAPAVAVQKVTAKATSFFVNTGATAAGALSSGAKAAENAVSGTVNKVLGYL